MSALNLTVIGLNHNSSPLELRESVSFTPIQRAAFIDILRNHYPIGEFVLLSTCNRVEIYISDPTEECTTQSIIALLASFHKISREDLMPYIYSYQGEHALKHLFEDASGLNSLVIGEAQIVGQVGKDRPSSVSPLPGLFFAGADVGQDNIGTELAADSALRVAPIIKDFLGR